MDISLKMMRRMTLPFKDDWHVVEEIGTGTYGSVFRIENRRGEVCALKVIPVPLTEQELNDQLAQANGDAALVSRVFDRTIDMIERREIGTAMQCAGCPNVFDIYERAVLVDETEPLQRYIVVRMEMLRDLKVHMRRRGVLQRDVLRMMEEIATALAFMSGKGILHRDIKPANIMVDDAGRYKLTDFGEARIIRGNDSRTAARGTPYYMAPEVNTGRYDCRADIYSLGMVAYYLLNGFRYPFEQYGDKAYEGYRRRMRGESCPPIAQVERSVNQILERCIAPSPGQRYSHPSELVRDLNRLLSDPSVGASPLFSQKRALQGGGSVPASDKQGLSTAAVVAIVVSAVVLVMMFVVALSATQNQGATLRTAVKSSTSVEEEAVPTPKV